MKKLTNALHALCMGAGIMFAAPALAAPVVPSPAYDAGLVVQVRGCHSNVQRHRVREFGRTLSHRHLRNCRPVRVTPARPRDCHRDVRRHQIPGYRGRVVHRHVGPRCIARIYR
ncbi:hypothetical protein GA830_17850 [Mesorhizobium sp. NBSH29]|uniref:hypothetical protein n=1 Tax=Mesorhizobium sp. NBSH29 TaxID=2654249 RepID=UPI00189678BB|nr:hypothetical protein [Mesorhizobium sp. NBSH29]QPC88410.1 hypothetical protein GA830_17850 [Mesorhizobium sp. NBSH29]